MDGYRGWRRVTKAGGQVQRLEKGSKSGTEARGGLQMQVEGYKDWWRGTEPGVRLLRLVEGYKEAHGAMAILSCSVKLEIIC